VRESPSTNQIRDFLASSDQPDKKGVGAVTWLGEESQLPSGDRIASSDQSGERITFDQSDKRL
jgi:hypothetical protein